MGDVSDTHDHTSCIRGCSCSTLDGSINRDDRGCYDSEVPVLASWAVTTRMLRVTGMVAYGDGAILGNTASRP